MLKTLNNLNFWFVLRRTIDHFRYFRYFRFRNQESGSSTNLLPERAKPPPTAATGPGFERPVSVSQTEDSESGRQPAGSNRHCRQARLLQAGMGPGFASLHPEIQARFAHTAREEPLRFVGVMSAVRLRPLGWLLAQLTRRSGLIPTRTGRQVPFEFNVRPLGLSWLKHRCYHFDQGPFHFSSVMTLDGQGRFVERFVGGLGMYLRLVAKDQNLVFQDDGYFLHWRRWTLPLPGFLHPGRFHLVHENLNAAEFRVLLSLRHAWFGTLIEQSGTFSG